MKSAFRSSQLIVYYLIPTCCVLSHPYMFPLHVDSYAVYARVSYIFRSLGEGKILIFPHVHIRERTPTGNHSHFIQSFSNYWREYLFLEKCKVSGLWWNMPTVIRMPQQHGTFGGAGIEICCGCRVCQCLNLGFLTSQIGLLKLFEIILGSCCETLLIQFGLSSASDIGQAFHGFLTTASACVMTSTILLICYVLSAKTFHLVRQSLFVSIRTM